jgi:hypothetical protein
MEIYERKPRSFGDLVVSVYDQVNAITDDTDLATRLAAHEVTRWLIKAGRLDLARRISLAARS